ncbi:MAG: OmpA family protein [Motiliproteus sp.]
MKFVIAILPVALLFGCAASDPYAFEKGGSTAAAQPNAMTRAVMGMPSSDSREPLTGPMGGSVQGSGHYMKQQEKALKEELDDSGVSVERKGDDIRLVMPGNITFATDSVKLETGFLPVLDAVARVLSRFDNTEMVVTGHTDSIGKASYNEQLAKSRAEAVAIYLKKSGIANERVKTVGRGEQQPIASNKTEDGRSSNRRVELDIRAR